MKKYRILFKYPSRGKGYKFLSVINNIISKVSDKENFIILVSADRDDAMMYNKEVLTAIKPHIDSSKVVICYDRSISKEDAMNRDMELISDYDILIQISDDTEFTVSGFDETLRGHFENVFADTKGNTHDDNGNDVRKVVLKGKITKDNLYDYKGSIIQIKQREPKVIYITGWYNEANEARRKELETCVKNAVDSKEFDEVILLCENCNPIENVSHSNISTRPTFEDFFLLANKSGSDGDVVAISNTDIYPSKGTKELLKNIKQDECYALSRWDINEAGNSEHFCRRDSQDIWVFRLPIVNIQANFYMGLAGCDNAIADRIQKAGYKVSNPSKTIQFNHLHLTKISNYNPNYKVDKPYLLINPTELNDVEVITDVIV